jgi:hypothetical protein
MASSRFLLGRISHDVVPCRVGKNLLHGDESDESDDGVYHDRAPAFIGVLIARGDTNAASGGWAGSSGQQIRPIIGDSRVEEGR